MTTPINVYRQLMLLRCTEEELAKLFISNKIFSFVHFYVGQEAVAVGVSNALLPSDRALGNHRSHGHYLAKGGNLRRMICEILGKAEGFSGGKGGSMHMIDKSQGFMGSSPILGSITSIAAGSAFVQKKTLSQDLTIAYIGDGASEEGGFYETLNIAALFTLPLMIVVENNLYSVNSKLSDRRSHDYSLEAIASGLGVLYAKANGNDYNDVYAKSDYLLSSVRKGSPAVLECEVFRHMAHSSPLLDDSQGYRELDLPDIRLKHDCILNFRLQLYQQGFSEVLLDSIDSEVRSLVSEEIAYALSAHFPSSSNLYSNLYE